MSGNGGLPPVAHLPHWTRVGRLGRASSSPRRLPAEPRLLLRPLPGAPAPAPEVSSAPAEHRVASLQKNIRFLQQQHSDTLERLHGEIEHLRRENKDLQYRMIMEPRRCSRNAAPTSGRRGPRPPTREREAPPGLGRGEEPRDTPPPQDRAPRSRGSDRKEKDSAAAAARGGVITSLQPLRIHTGSSHSPRPPTLQECEVIIRQLYSANSLQSREILRVKALLREIVFSKKITSENFLLTKAVLLNGSCRASEEKKFPKLGLQTSPQKTSGSSEPGPVLPALKQSLSSTVAQRQRRTRALQRDRFNRTVH